MAITTSNLAGELDGEQETAAAVVDQGGLPGGTFFLDEEVATPALPTDDDPGDRVTVDASCTGFAGERFFG